MQSFRDHLIHLREFRISRLNIHLNEPRLHWNPPTSLLALCNNMFNCCNLIILTDCSCKTSDWLWITSRQATCPSQTEKGPHWRIPTSLDFQRELEITWKDCRNYEQGRREGGGPCSDYFQGFKEKEFNFRRDDKGIPHSDTSATPNYSRNEEKQSRSPSMVFTEIWKVYPMVGSCQLLDNWHSRILVKWC